MPPGAAIRFIRYVLSYLKAVSVVLLNTVIICYVVLSQERSFKNPGKPRDSNANAFVSAGLPRRAMKVWGRSRDWERSYSTLQTSGKHQRTAETTPWHVRDHQVVASLRDVRTAPEKPREEATMVWNRY